MTATAPITGTTPAAADGILATDQATITFLRDNEPSDKIDMPCFGRIWNAFLQEHSAHNRFPLRTEFITVFDLPHLFNRTFYGSGERYTFKPTAQDKQKLFDFTIDLINELKKCNAADEVLCRTLNRAERRARLWRLKWETARSRGRSNFGGSAAGESVAFVRKVGQKADRDDEVETEVVSDAEDEEAPEETAAATKKNQKQSAVSMETDGL